MEKQISTGLRTTFLLHFIVALVFGLVYLLIPEIFGSLVGWQIQDTAVFRLLGVAVLGFGLSSWLAYRTDAWEKVRIIVQQEIFWTVLGTLVTLIALLSGALPAIGWLNAIILAAFGAAFIVFYRRH